MHTIWGFRFCIIKKKVWTTVGNSSGNGKLETSRNDGYGRCQWEWSNWQMKGREGCRWEMPVKVDRGCHRAAAGGGKIGGRRCSWFPARHFLQWCQALPANSSSASRPARFQCSFKATPKGFDWPVRKRQEGWERIRFFLQILERHAAHARKSTTTTG